MIRNTTQAFPEAVRDSIPINPPTLLQSRTIITTPQRHWKFSLSQSLWNSLSIWTLYKSIILLSCAHNNNTYQYQFHLQTSRQRRRRSNMPKRLRIELVILIHILWSSSTPTNSGANLCPIGKILLHFLPLFTVNLLPPCSLHQGESNPQDGVAWFPSIFI